jgi:hypothetical protein
MNSVNLRLAGTIGLAAVILAGCATQLEQDATAKLEADCAARGMQFVKTGSEKTEAIIVSSAQVGGECVGPGDPRYVSR